MGAFATTSESTDRLVEKCGKLPGLGKMKLMEKLYDVKAFKVISLDFC